MQSPGQYDPRGVQAMVAALRKPQGVQVAGDVVPYDFTAHGDYTKAGPSAPNLETQMQNIKQLNTGNVAIPKNTILNWLNTPPSVGRVYNAPSSTVYHALGFPPTQGPWPPGSGGNLPPKM